MANCPAGDATREEMQLQIICNLVVYLYLIYENDNKPTNAIYVFVAGQCKKGSVEESFQGSCSIIKYFCK